MVPRQFISRVFWNDEQWIAALYPGGDKDQDCWFHPKGFLVTYLEDELGNPNAALWELLSGVGYVCESMFLGG